MNPHSFTQYVKTQLSDDLYELSDEFLRENYSIIIKEKCLRRFDLSDISIRRVNVQDAQNDRIRFDVVVAVEIDAYHESGREDQIEVWLRVFFSMDLDRAPATPIHIRTDFCEQKERTKNGLSDQLVPYISRKDYEARAEEFLDEYYPDWKKQGSIDPYLLAKRMGLQIIERKLSMDGTVFGQIVFFDREEKFFQENGQKSRETVSAGTIVIDPAATHSWSIGSIHNTIVHECIHFGLHRKCFLLEKLLNPELTAISCNSNGENGVGQADAFQIMEVQANALAPRVLMPREAVIDLVLDSLEGHEEATEDPRQMDAVIRKLSEHFQVSRSAAKIRLVELGFHSALGCFYYLDGRYLQPFSYQMAKEDAQKFTYAIGEIDLIRLLASNKSLREYTVSHKLLYIDGHLVYDTPLFISRNIGTPFLTEYALTHMDECAIPFEIEAVRGVSATVRYYTECILFREKDSPYVLELKFNEQYLKQSGKEKEEVLQEALEDGRKLVLRLTNDFATSMRLAKDWSGMTYEEIADKVNLDKRQVRRIFHGEGTKTNTLVAILLAMKLPVEVSLKLMELSPCPLRFSNQEHCIFYHALITLRGYDMDVIRKKLDKLGATL